jgi:hypothetical protein
MLGNDDNCPAATSSIAPQPLIVRTIPARCPHDARTLDPVPVEAKAFKLAHLQLVQAAPSRPTAVPLCGQSASVATRLQGVPGSAPNTALVLGDRIWRGSVETGSSIN